MTKRLRATIKIVQALRKSGQSWAYIRELFDALHQDKSMEDQQFFRDVLNQAILKVDPVEAFRETFQ